MGKTDTALLPMYAVPYLKVETPPGIYDPTYLNKFIMRLNINYLTVKLTKLMQ
jgi:hypothetical protein